MLECISEFVKVNTILSRPIGKISRLGIHRFVHLWAICIRPWKTGPVACCIERATLWCLDTVVSMHTRSRTECWLIIVWLALARIMWVVVWWWIDSLGLTVIDAVVVVDVTWVRTTEAFLSWEEIP